MNINEALSGLDPNDDEAWTGQGLPRLDVMRLMVRNPDLTRAQLTEASPEFTRQTAAKDFKSDVAADTPDKPEDTNVEAPTESEPEAKASEEVMVPATDARSYEGSTAAPEPESLSIPEPAAPIAAKTQLDTLKAALELHTEAMTAAQQAKGEAEKLARAASDEVNALNRKIDALTRHDPHAATAGIRDYIKSQGEQRALKAQRVKEFMGTSGAHPNAVAKALEVRSPLDKAMHGRKPPRGTQRPPTRQP